MIDSANLDRFTRDSETPIDNPQHCLKFVMYQNPQPVCYLNECTSCLGTERLSTYLKETLEDRGIVQIIFSTWQSTDRCVSKKECLLTEDFVAELCKQLDKFKPHHFVSKIQSKYISERKSNLQEGEVLVYSDFSENYAYVAQDAAQAFHYNSDQCTVHPVVIYYKEGNNIAHHSFVFLSECTTHDTTAVYTM